MTNPACDEVLEEVAALPAASLRRLRDQLASENGEYSRAISGDESQSVSPHLRDCAFCREEIAFLIGASETLATLPAPALPQGFAARVQNAIANVPQEIAREYSQEKSNLAPCDVSTFVASSQASREAPEDETRSIPATSRTVEQETAPPLVLPSQKRDWRARFGFSNRREYSRRGNLKFAWASGTALAAFALLLATQIQTPLISPRGGDEVFVQSGSAPREPSSASTRDAASTKKPMAPRTTAASPSLAAPQIARKAAPEKSKAMAPPVASGGVSEPIESSRAAPKAQNGIAISPVERESAPIPRRKKAPLAKENAPSLAQPERAPRVETPSREQRRALPAMPQRPAPPVFVAPPPAAKAGPRQNAATNTMRAPQNRDAAAQKSDSKRAETSQESAPGLSANNEKPDGQSAAAAGGASTRAMPGNIQKSRAAPENDAAQENEQPNAPASASESANDSDAANSQTFAAPRAMMRSRVARPPISLRVSIAAPRDLEQARLRLELPGGVRFVKEPPENVVWSGALTRGERAFATVAILDERAASDSQSLRIRAVLESRERGEWREIAAKEVEAETP